MTKTMVFFGIVIFLAIAMLSITGMIFSTYILLNWLGPKPESVAVVGLVGFLPFSLLFFSNIVFLEYWFNS
jgi:hypothetical protein